MPEGDTIYRVARTLQIAIGGRTVTRFQSEFPHLNRIDEDHPLSGRSVESVAAAGKHLLIRFSGDLVLRSHMRMNGSWHVYRPGERWQRRRSDMRVIIETGEWIAVGFSIPVAEFLDSKSLARQSDLSAMGPDALAATFDRNEALDRLRARPDEEIANALLNQRVIAGIGNVYKSEVLFLCRINPFRKTRELSDEDLERILDASRAQIKANVIDAERNGVAFPRAMRVTTRRIDPNAKLWVYGRKGDPCRTCGTPVERRSQGPDARATYWCPSCQP
ncbi:MAG TPA: DNA-formamidopyrimidine glycosylase family protein [Thermoanaerobaculia bacterium]|nr:DNA-formamidopyrimidine glycosylase family protein [Thermoanaerobaculia bacterium]